MKIADGSPVAKCLVREGARALILPDDILLIYRSF
jgi:hypothetical protein